jgi:hypothetical protein
MPDKMKYSLSGWFFKIFVSRWRTNITISGTLVIRSFQLEVSMKKKSKLGVMTENQDITKERGLSALSSLNYFMACSDVTEFYYKKKYKY